MSEADIATFAKRIHTFMGLFAQNKDNSAALESTPYIHWLCHHAVASLRAHGPLGLYSCESLERHNSFLRRFVTKNSNNKDPAFYAFHYEQLTHMFSFMRIKKRSYTLRTKTSATAQQASENEHAEDVGRNGEQELTPDDHSANEVLPDICVELNEGEDDDMMDEVM